MSRAHTIRCVLIIVFFSSVFWSTLVGAGLKNATLVLIRHAEKPDHGDGLTAEGEARARAYVGYFQNFKFHAEPLNFDAVFAAADSKASERPRLTVTPMATALNLSVNTNYKAKDYQAFADELSAHHEGRKILICWHHGQMPDLLRSLGADPSGLLPGGRWPESEYDWVIILRYDHDGHLKDAERIDAGLTGSHR